MLRVRLGDAELVPQRGTETSLTGPALSNPWSGRREPKYKFDLDT